MCSVKVTDQHQAADLLSTGSPLSQIHTELCESPSQVSPGSRVPQPAARLQAGESRHPGDDRLLHDTAAAAEPAAEKTDEALQQAAVFL